MLLLLLFLLLLLLLLWRLKWITSLILQCCKCSRSPFDVWANEDHSRWLCRYRWWLFGHWRRCYWRLFQWAWTSCCCCWVEKQWLEVLMPPREVWMQSLEEDSLEPFGSWLKKWRAGPMLRERKPRRMQLWISFWRIGNWELIKEKCSNKYEDGFVVELFTSRMSLWNWIMSEGQKFHL